MGVSVQFSTEVRRSDFLRGKLGRTAPDIRPPWAIYEGIFQDVCTGCDACISACPTSILKKSRGGYPIVDFSKNECRFCGDCATACKPRAIDKDSESRPWSLVAAFQQTCLSSSGVTCRVCGDVCNAGAIAFKLAIGGRAIPTIDSSRCTGCGACVAPCPVDAVQIQMEEVRTK